MKIIIAKDALYDSDYQLWYVHVALGDLDNLKFTAWGKTAEQAKACANIIVNSLKVRQFSLEILN